MENKKNSRLEVKKKEIFVDGVLEEVRYRVTLFLKDKSGYESVGFRNVLSEEALLGLYEGFTDYFSKKI